MNIMKKLLLNPRFSFGVEDVNRSDMLEVDIGCGLKTYCVGWLALLAHYEVKLPGEYLNKISFFDTDFKVLNNRVGKLMSIAPRVVIKDGYYLIPNFTKYVINERGDVKNLKTWESLSWQMNAYGYNTVNIYDADKSGYRGVAVHLLLGYTFIVNNSPSENVVIDHVDGDKLNIRLDNLEWVTSSENNRRALVGGLRTDNLACEVRDVTNFEVTEYVSVSEACRAIGFNSKQSLTTVYNGEIIPNLLKNRYEIRLLSEEREWYHQSAWNVRPIIEGPFEILNVETKEKFIAQTLKQSSIIMGVDHSVVSNRLSKPVIESVNGFAIRFPSNDPWPEVIQERVYIAPRTISVENIDTGEVVILDSINKVHLYTGIDKQTLRSKIRKGIPHKGFRYIEIQHKSSCSESCIEFSL